ncbi:hypothetical protein [Acidiphilium acidophilum]|uniref:Uncharacterized protein n=1 Tax=Acidiphilium acidophilum TaxID=76588 RepID=A0AAW9DUS8_ACIAO|nr:hypothetical protein [Acidiphilium acidophilum]MDX5932453.1 hypothetical protein [Acidiphilium acidophilum]
MNAASPLFTRFAGFIDRLKQTIAAASVKVQGRPARLPAPIGLLLYGRLSRLTTRLRDLLARIEAERTKPRRIAAPRTGRKSTTKPPPVLPRRFGWIAQPLPEANAHAQTLRQFLCEPETESLIASDPRIGRILRPLCHLLGIDLTLIYRMVPPPHPQDAPQTKPHPLLRNPSTKPRPQNPHPRLPKPPDPPLRAPTLDAIQSLLDQTFSPRAQTHNPWFTPSDFFIVHPK